MVNFVTTSTLGSLRTVGDGGGVRAPNEALVLIDQEIIQAIVNTKSTKNTSIYNVKVSCYRH